MGILDLFSGMTTTSLIIRSIGAGFVIGSLVSTVSRRVSHGIYKRLLQNQAVSSETAVTLKQMGLDKKPFVKHALKEDSPMRRGVFVSHDGAPEKSGGKKKTDFETAAFYIPEERMAYMSARYGRGASFAMWILCAAVIIAAAEAAVYYVPKLIGLI